MLDIRKTIKEWKLKGETSKSMNDVAKAINPIIRGWIEYYGKFRPSELKRFFYYLNKKLAWWLKRKYKRFKGKHKKAYEWLGVIAKRDPSLFYHWEWGACP